jgi:hypothetical protein
MRYLVTSAFLNTLFSDSVDLSYSLTASDQVAVVQNTDHYYVLLMRQILLILRFMVQTLDPIYFTAYIKHKIPHLYLTLCFVTAR